MLEAFRELREWVHASLEEYKAEFMRVLYPLFAFCYLDLVDSGERERAAKFFETFHGDFGLTHREELNLLRQVCAPQQEQKNDYVQRLKLTRYHVEMSAYARTLLLTFLHKNKLPLLLGALNKYVAIKQSTLQPSMSAIRDDGVCSAHGAKRQLWDQVDEQKLAELNAAELSLGALAAVEEKQQRLAATRLSKLGGAALASAELPRKHRRGSGSGAHSDGEDAASAATARPPLLSTPRVPMPPLSDKVEKEHARDAAKRLDLSAARPSALLLSVLDSKRHARLCCASFSNDCAMLACGCADSAVRLYLLRPQAHGKKAAAAAAAA
eukprot:CAMPEP_0119386274 /NCGR_PEP_ID=MMETSP1334-20130426/95247_1 /TAXON_ID=127549 /ORGANISM="Calcidiscus leptoporus, Strain RCC1130" /LENGTH=324 /DNA_ID=CAMNT_0007407741 /DNA_START=59 /DNA_END=1029 /DNA_ORIENTATION=-